MKKKSTETRVNALAREAAALTKIAEHLQGLTDEQACRAMAMVAANFGFYKESTQFIRLAKQLAGAKKWCDGPRYPAKQALEVALDLVQQLNPFCPRLVIAGSLRRKKPTVGDVEILFVPRMVRSSLDLFREVSAAEEPLNAMLAKGVLSKRRNKVGGFIGWGPENKFAVHEASGIPVDLFATTEKNWWVSLVIRTGSKETNLKLTTGAQALNKSLNAYGYGVTNSDGTTTPAVSERDVFELCGVPYLEPEMR